MIEIIKHIKDRLINDLRNANEIWIAVALINNKGLNDIIENIKENTVVNILFGIDLPSEPKAIKKLFELVTKKNFNVLLHSTKDFFHPKLYIIKTENSLISYLGSANCTNGGFSKNVELNVRLTEQKVCEDLISWFNIQYSNGKPITKRFLSKYEEDYQKRIERKKTDEKEIDNDKNLINQEYNAILNERDDLVNTLKDYRKNLNYKDIKKERQEDISKLRVIIDYPKFKNIEVEDFFKFHSLGHLIEIPKPTIKREIIKFSELLKMLCNEQIDIADRYNQALNGNLKIRGVSEGLITKILTIHNPNEYFVKNDKSETALKKYGIQLPRGISKGDKYKTMCKLLKQICIETKIDDFAIFDYFMYLEGSK